MTHTLRFLSIMDLLLITRYKHHALFAPPLSYCVHLYMYAIMCIVILNCLFVTFISCTFALN